MMRRSAWDEFKTVLRIGELSIRFVRQFRAADGDVVRGFNADLNSAPLNFHHRDAHTVTDDDGLSRLPAKN